MESCGIINYTYLYTILLNGYKYIKMEHENYSIYIRTHKTEHSKTLINFQTLNLLIELYLQTALRSEVAVGQVVLPISDLADLLQAGLFAK